MNKTITIDGVEYNLTPVESDKTKYPNAAKWGKVTDGSITHYINIFGGVKLSEHRFDDELYNIANSFATVEAAQDMADKQTLQRKIERWRDGNDPKVIDWDNTEQRKWSYYYCLHEKAILINGTTGVRIPNITYFSSAELVKQCIDTFQDDILKIQFGG